MGLGTISQCYRSTQKHCS